MSLVESSSHWEEQQGFSGIQAGLSKQLTEAKDSPLSCQGTPRIPPKLTISRFKVLDIREAAKRSCRKKGD